MLACREKQPQRQSVDQQPEAENTESKEKYGNKNVLKSNLNLPSCSEDPRTENKEEEREVTEGVMDVSCH